MNVNKSARVAMAQRGMKQGDLAKLMGISQPTLSQILNKDTCSGPVLQRMADAFGLPVSKFIELGED